VQEFMVINFNAFKHDSFSTVTNYTKQPKGEVLYEKEPLWER
jgi:hypothetical protein